jgi:hypothetical protein
MDEIIPADRVERHLNQVRNDKINEMTEQPE